MHRRILHLAGLFIATLFIGVLDYATGDELDLFILYLVPIAIGAWTHGRAVALVLAATSGALWFSANVYLGHAYSRPVLGAWGEVVMLITFTAAALATNGMRSLLDREKALNAQLAEALARVKKLSGRLPICMSCKSVQDESGHWREIEEYFTHESEDDFVFKQMICPHCRVAPGAVGTGVAGAQAG
jgi:hypothetical protein